MIRLIRFLFLFVTLFVLQTKAQYSIIIIQKDSSNKVVLNFETRAKQQEMLQHSLNGSLNNGFRLIKIDNDTITKKTSSIFFGCEIGFQISNIDSLKKSSTESFIDKSAIKKSLSPKQFFGIMDQILVRAENSGYPFITIIPKYMLTSDSIIDVVLTIDKGPMIRYDSLVVKGNSKVSPGFLTSFLGVKKGKLFNQKELKTVDSRLKKMAFLQLEKSSEVAFIDSNMLLILYLNKKNSSQFDGIVGILPQSGNENRPIITGDVKLNLQNLFNRGEQIWFNWRRSDPLSQDLIVNSSFPYIANSKYGAIGELKLIKKDTTTITTTIKVGGQLFIYAMNNVSAYYENTSSKLLSTFAIRSSGLLGDNMDYTIHRYGLSSTIDMLNDVWIPTKGIKLYIDLNVGSRKATPNIAIPIEMYANVLDSKTNMKVVSQLECYYPIYKKIIFNFSHKLNLLSGNNHYENEMFRFGGLTNLRGFNEETFLASFYTMANIEIRWLLDRQTYLFGFWNGAYYEKNTTNKFIHDTPNGFGVGLSFDTPAGIFNITYALGKEFNNPIQLKYGKVHFGIVARF